MTFFAERAHRGSPSLQQLESHAPDNPFSTVAYAEAMSRLRREIWVIGIRTESGDVESASIAVMRTGRLSRIIEIESLCRGASRSQFWDGLTAFCIREKVTDLSIGTFNSPPINIPRLPGEVGRKARREHVLRLQEVDLTVALSSNHRRNVKKGRAAQLTMTCTRDAAACESHVRLMQASVVRREKRGEQALANSNIAEYAAFLECGAGEIFQAVQNGTVVSSVLVLRSAAAGYYHSAGSSPDGMAVGASHFLIHSISTDLKNRGVEMFNLGGAEDGSSLERFKVGFGASPVELTSSVYAFGPRWRRKLRLIVDMARTDPARLVRLVTGSFRTSYVYAVDVARVEPTVSVRDGDLQALSGEALKALDVDDAFRQQQLSRLGRYESAEVFGVFIGGRLAHVSWLFRQGTVNADPQQILRLKPDEAEISACETLPAYRGQGAYPFAIQRICMLARRNGIRRIYMKTTAQNTASQSGIRKAGLRREATVVEVFPPGSRGRRWVMRLPV